MNDKVINALRNSTYKVITDDQDLENVYRLRYKCYRAEQCISANERQLMTDEFDSTANCVQVAVEFGGNIMAAVRLHLYSEISHASPTLEVFPEILHSLPQGHTVLDPTRFVVDPAIRMHRVPLHFLVLRIPFLATMFYDIDLALAPVRAEHSAFYRRYLGYEKAIKGREYPGLKKPVQLLTCKVREHRSTVLARTPVFGPVNEIPNSNIVFPSLTGTFVSRDGSRFSAA